jgi:hypothetical protein
MSSRIFNLEAGLVIITLHHQGAERFIANLVAANGMLVSELVSTAGQWVGTRAIIIPEDGEYRFEVTADADWWVEVMYPLPENAVRSPLPYSNAGTGTQALYFIEVPPGEHTMTVNTTNTLYTSVSIHSFDGSIRVHLIDWFGPFSGSVPFTIIGDENDLVYIAIDLETSGNWEISVE